jgi:hypothetical protein
MFSRKLTLGLAIGAALAFAAPAQAVVVDTDQPTLRGDDHDFDGSLKFDLSGGRIEPRLTGTLQMSDADGTCARMHLEYFDKNDVALTDTEHGGTVCVNDDRSHDFSVDLEPYRDDDIEKVKVQLEKQTASGWYVVDSSYFAVDTFDDSVKITEDGVDFGNGAWVSSGPAGSGDMSWGLDSGVVDPRLTGTLHLNNSSGVCARINLRYLTADGTFWTERHGGAKCASDNGHHEYDIDLSPYDSNKVAKVKVQLQTQGSNGSWNTAGSDTVSIAE